ncbi:hypothetical protein [Rhizobium rhizogenes]|nr:hypothetical protein [Rhizobium rhizogenes]
MAEQNSKKVEFKEFKSGVGATPVKIDVSKDNYQIALGKTYFPL